jgi:hypothetical protein
MRILFILSVFGIFSFHLFAAEKLRDFRATNQSLALIGLSSEFVDPSQESRLIQELRRKFNKYTKSYGDSSIDAFKLGANQGKQFFRPVAESLPEPQKKFLQATCKDNAIDILVLGSMRLVGEDVEFELQLFDARIEALSKIEKAQIRGGNDPQALDLLVYRVMNYLDREGYVYNTPQEFLEQPLSFRQGTTQKGPSFGSDDFSLNPNELSSGTLAGGVSIGGDKVPFWEKWWFWALIGGGLATAGSLTYYFMVVDQPPTAANVNVTMP